MADIERESMDYDVVIVGAGPAGLSAAIRLKQLDPDLSVVVLEKGSEVGAHILSGAVLDPVGLDALLPDWRRMDAPIRTEVSEDRFYLLGQAGQVRLPNWPMPKLMSNHGNYIVSMGNVCRWLAAQAEGLGVEIFPGMAASRAGGRRGGDAQGASSPGSSASTRTGSRGRATSRGWSSGASTPSWPRACAARCRGRRSRAGGSRNGREPQKYGLGMKEIWEVEPARHRLGQVTHTMGWPLGQECRRRVVHVPPGEQPGLRRLRRPPELREPVPQSLHGVPALQAPSADRGGAEGRQARRLRRARHLRGRVAVDPEARLPGRRAPRRQRGLRQRPAHQGQPQRHPLGHRRRRGGAARDRAEPGGRRAHRIRRGGRERADRPRPEAGAEPEADLVALRAHRLARPRGARHVGELALRQPLALRHAPAPARPTPRRPAGRSISRPSTTRSPTASSRSTG